MTSWGRPSAARSNRTYRAVRHARMSLPSFRLPASTFTSGTATSSRRSRRRAIVIPYGEAAKVSWFDHVRAMIGQYQWAAGGAFAAVTFAFAAYFLLLPAVSKEQAYVPSVPPSIEIASQPVQAERKPVEHSITPVKETGKRAPSSPQMEKANISVSKNPRPATIPAQPLVASTRPKTSQPAVVKRSKAPRLNDFEDEDDNTLRLGDLMADIGARKE